MVCADCGKRSKASLIGWGVQSRPAPLDLRLGPARSSSARRGTKWRKTGRAREVPSWVSLCPKCFEAQEARAPQGKAE